MCVHVTNKTSCTRKRSFTCFKDTVAHILVTGTSALEISVFGLHLRLSCTIFTGTRLLGFWSTSSMRCSTTVTCVARTFTGWNCDLSGSDGFSWFSKTEVTLGSSTTGDGSYGLTSTCFGGSSAKSGTRGRKSRAFIVARSNARTVGRPVVPSYPLPLTHRSTRPPRTLS